MQSSQWLGKGSSRTKKSRLSRQNFKAMLVVFFDWKDIVHHEFIPRGQMENRLIYQDVLAHLRDAVCWKRTELCGKPELDVVPRQCAGSRVVPHPQLSDKTSDFRCALSTLFSGLRPSTLFLVSQT